MKIYKARVYINERKSVASHFVDVEKDPRGRTEFHFKRVVHNLDDSEKFPIPDVNPATFKEQLRSLNRAYAITRISDDKETQFIENMLKEAYPDAEDIVIEELH
ncbi:MAG: hypothetical protein JRE10_16470 [Deltaproteobacteria bacterium]|nr:hypothetical protein [Deltaproteobacteria bacterium]